MGLAIKEAYLGRKLGNPPFGCVIVTKKCEIISKAHDSVKEDKDMTSHSVTNAIKKACRKIGPDLNGCTVYSTCEPCPMCFGAIWLSRAKTIVFGSYMDDVIKYSKNKVREMNVSAGQLNKMSGSEIQIIKELLRDQCIALWTDLYV